MSPPANIKWRLQRWRSAVDNIDDVERYVLRTWKRSTGSLKLEHDADTARRLLHGATELWIAESPAFEDVIAGWLLVSPISPPVIHYLYVRNTARGMGCASALLAAAGVPRGELYTSQNGRIPPPLSSWYQRVTRVEPRLAFT